MDTCRAAIEGQRRPSHAVPSRFDALIFHLKAAVFRTRRGLANVSTPQRRLNQIDGTDFRLAAAASRTILWSEIAMAEQPLQRGKVHNLRAAARYLDRTFIPAGTEFSFWRQLGRLTRARGFTRGRMLQEGCLVPSIGGGICQLSNALYDVALQAGCEIVERHPHSRIVPGSQATRGRDATVAWNYVDLRFRSARPLLLRVRVNRNELEVELRTREIGGAPPGAETDDDARDMASSCATCGEVSCFRHRHVAESGHATTAFLVDEFWPEFDEYIRRAKAAGDVLCLPIDGIRWRRPQYGWDVYGFSRVVDAPVQTILRGLASRRLAAQGAARQRALIKSSEALATRYGRALTADVSNVVVTQSLLPFLWREGYLGGRAFSVLMTRLPIAVLQERLDLAAHVRPDCGTLADFRAPKQLLEEEAEALAAADHIVMPHADIAALFGDRAILLDWKQSRVAARATAPQARRIAFPGPTLGRKGAYELREAARALDLDVILLGSELEGPEFWRGIRTHRADRANWLDGVAAVVQPAFVEDKPRRLLEALAAGVPVIATKECGVRECAGLTLVPSGDIDALTKALAAISPHAC
jgi:hypothetical protein